MVTSMENLDNSHSSFLLQEKCVSAAFNFSLKNKANFNCIFNNFSFFSKVRIYDGKEKQQPRTTNPSSHIIISNIIIIASQTHDTAAGAPLSFVIKILLRNERQ